LPIADRFHAIAESALTMNGHQLVFFKLLEMELGRSGNPATDNNDLRHMTALAAQELKRVLVEETVMPAHRAKAVAAYRALLAALRSNIDESLYIELDQSLSNAAQDWPSLESVLGNVTTVLLARDNAPLLELAGQLIAIDSRIRDSKEAACLERSKTEPPAADKIVTGSLSMEQQARLHDFLRLSFPTETGLRIAAVRPLAGGFSKQTLFIDLTGNDELPDTLVMRRDAPYETQGSSVSMEFPVLKKMHAAGVCVPQPYALEASGKVLGTPFILVSQVAGRVLGDFLVVSEPNREAALNIARQVARLHAVPVDGLENLLHGGVVAVRDRVLGEIEKHEIMWKGIAHQHAYVVQAAIDWLKRNIARADGPRAVIHRDIGVHNLLVDNNDVTAFLDWETVVIGTPGEDVGYCYYQMTQIVDWNEFVATYEKAAGITLDRRQLDFYVLWGSVRIAIGICRMVEPVYNGDRPSLLHFYIGDYFVQMLMRRISSKLAEILV
jgi:aminoglycoside phosphotransferase (APT) family kinase protein